MLQVHKSLLAAILATIIILLILVIELTFPSSFEELLVQEFNLSIVDDNIVEPTEQIELFLNTSQEGVLIDVEATVATVYVFNDDSENQIYKTQ